MELKSRLGPITAVIIGLGAAAWMFSGSQGIMTAQATTSETEQPKTLTLPDQATDGQAPKTAVQAAALSAQIVSNAIKLSGETKANHILTLSNQVAGHVSHIYAKKGDYLKQGAPILAIDHRTIEANLNQAHALLKQRQLELAGVKKLSAQALASKVKFAQAEAALAAAQANVTALEVELENATLTAPFSGVLNDFAIKSGQWLSSGATIGELVDIQPLKVAVNIPQINLSNITLNTPVSVSLNNGQSFASKISYISSLADPTTRTLPVEIEVENNDLSLPAGISAQVSLQLNKVKAHAFSPALLHVNDQGDMSVKTLDLDNKVVSKRVTVVRSDRDKVWVTGLPDKVSIITVGQGFVNDGDIVEAHYQQ